MLRPFLVCAWGRSSRSGPGLLCLAAQEARDGGRMVEGRGGSGKTGGVSSSWYRTYSTHPLAPFLDWGRGKRGGGFACSQRENYKRLSTGFTNADRYAKIRNEGMHTLTEPFPTFAAGSRPVSAFVGTASQTSDTFGEGTGVGPANLAPDVIGPSQTREPV